MLLEVQKGVAGVISEMIAIIFERSHGYREILETQLGFRSRLRSLTVGLHVRAGCLNFHFHQWRVSQRRVGSNVPHPTVDTDGQLRLTPLRIIH